MIKKLPCLYGYIGQTKTGDRNTNLFKAINHLRHYNKTATDTEIINEALQINNSFTSPLSQHEVTVICNHVMAKEYRTSCWKFKKYCQHCKHGKFHKTFRNSKPGYWKHINENNKLVGIPTVPDDTFHPWDIIDTDKLTPEVKADIQKSREERGIPIGIDRVVKAYDIPIGFQAERQWERFKQSD